MHRVRRIEVANFPSNTTAFAHLAVLYFVTGNRARVNETLERLVAANPAPPAYELAARTLDALEDPVGAAHFRGRIPR